LKAPADAYFSNAGQVEYASGQSLDVANEALQILGQIVADRASGAALELLLERLRKALKCSTVSNSQFPRTCSAIDAVRLTDFAGSGRALLQAVLSDALDQVLKAENVALDDDVRKLGIDLIATVVIPEILRAADGKNAKASSTLIAKQLMEAALKHLQNPDVASNAFKDGSVGQAVVLSAAAAFARCVASSRGEDGKPLDQCPIVDFAREEAEKFGLSTNERALFAARALAADVLDALTLRKEEFPDWNGRVLRALDAMFATTCLLASKDESLETCPATLPTSRPANKFAWLSVAHAMLASTLDRDVNGVLVGLSLVVGESEKKGLRLLGGVLRYAQTYTDRTLDPEGAHEERVKLLNDLTKEMTDRTSRDGDCVWSLGGALQLVAGGRLPLEGDEDVAFYGPLALPIGIGVQEVDGGIHVGLGIVDLGQYVSWEPGLEVAEPDVVDAFAPSVTVGYAWGKSFPAFVGLNAGYAPHYRFSENTSRGSLNIGATVGVYVPFVDLN
jgi:hypothetical protein